MAWVDAADMMYSTGLEQYPESVFLHIAYANFLSTYKKSSAVSSWITCNMLQNASKHLTALHVADLHDAAGMTWQQYKIADATLSLLLAPHEFASCHSFDSVSGTADPDDNTSGHCTEVQPWV